MAERIDGGDVSGGGWEEIAEEGFWNIFKMSILAGLEGAEGVDDVAGVDDDEVAAIEDLDEIEAFPFT